jgi:hypothetical protein
MGGFRIERRDGAQAREVEATLRLIYGEAFAERPYRKTEADTDATFRRFHSQTEKPTFRAALAHSATEPAGMAYSYALSASTGWWATLTQPVPVDRRRENGNRTFGLIELAVRP